MCDFNACRVSTCCLGFACSIYPAARFVSHAGVRQVTRTKCYRRWENHTHHHQTEKGKACTKRGYLKVPRQPGRNRRRYKRGVLMSHADGVWIYQGLVAVPCQHARHESEQRKVRVVHALLLTRGISLGDGIASVATSFGRRRRRTSTLTEAAEGANTETREKSLLQHLGCGCLRGRLLVRSVGVDKPWVVSPALM